MADTRDYSNPAHLRGIEREFWTIEAAEEVRSPEGGIPFHPPLFAAFPILSIYSANLALIPLSDLWLPVGVAMALSIPVWAVCSLLCWNISRGASAASVICGTAVLYAPVSRSLPFLKPQYLWFFIVLLAAGGLAYFVKKGTFLNLIASLLVTVSLGGILWGEIVARVDLGRMTRDDAGKLKGTSGSTPDIFYIILDGYGRQDMLRRLMNFDNSAFINGLKARGFYVAARSHSNYVQTEISLSSSLNCDFIPKLLPHMASSSTNRGPFDALISDNFVSRQLRSAGYRNIAITSGFPPVRFPFADLWLTHSNSTTLFEATLLQMTPFINTNQETESLYSVRRSDILDALRNARDLAAESSRPKFVFVHVLAPHPPFVFGPNGEAVKHHGPYGLWDGSDYITYIGPASEYRNGYVGQATYLNTQVLKTVDALLSSNRKPIILIQGDHGSKMRLDQDSLKKTDVTECFENLSAYYVPPKVEAKLYPTITPVNSFRIILSTLFGANLPNLPDQSWYSPYSYPFQFTDVSSRVEPRP
jgi:hypothetical protein